MQNTAGDNYRFERDLKQAARTLKNASSVRVVTHIDADGITAGAIADITLERLGIEHTVGFEKKITDDVIDSVNSSPEDLVWVCDLGSGYMSGFDRDGLIVTDHHIPDPKWRGKQTVLDSFCGVDHLNPHMYGIDGSFEICGAGMTYFLSRTVNPENKDLAYLGVVGAVGDFQDSSFQQLVGPNRDVLMDAVYAGDLVIEKDLRYFGRDTRPITQYLQYATDPSIPGLSENPPGCLNFLDELGIQPKSGNTWKVWTDLDANEHDDAIASIEKLLGENACKAVGEMYRITRYERRSGLSDAKEFATMLNSCGRYDDAPTGLQVCRGNVEAVKTAEKNRSEHRKHISSAISYVRENHLLRERRFIQWFDVGSNVRETVVGIVAGMILSSPECRRNIPIIAFADSDDGVKVSARGSRSMVDQGLDLAAVMNIASGLVGGTGGGHSVAAGATIPPEKKEEFLDIVEDLVSSQIV